MANLKTYKIVIPSYKAKLNHNETLVLKRLRKFYDISDLCVVCPASLNAPTEISSFEIHRFKDSYFESIDGYNQLLLSEEFYDRFSRYKFILIHQLDAYLFKNEIDYWCQKNYDYIGAPWLRDERFFTKLFRSKKIKKREIIFNKVGNGGLSLRKVETFLEITKKYKHIIQDCQNHPLYKIEDVFWSLKAPELRSMSIPDCKTAAKFSLDRKPEKGMKMNNYKLPFGCHGFEKNKTKGFWKEYIDGLE